jgi:DNA-binding FadR family transcriptional regulator
VLEAAAVERLAYAGDASHYAELRRIIEEEQRSLGDREAWFVASLSFHARLVDMTGLITLTKVNEILGEITDRHLSRRRSVSPPNWVALARRVIKAHIKLVGFIEERNTAQAKDFWTLHMERSAALLFEDRAEETVLDLFDEASRGSIPPSDRNLKAAELLADFLRRRIVHGELDEGQMLPPESQLAEELGAGRPALREALRILESESLVAVERGSRGGGRVRTPSPLTAARPLATLLQLAHTTIEDVYETRMIIEPAAARWLAEHGSAEAKTDLRLLADAGRQHIEESDAWALHALQFHREVVARCGLETLSCLGGLVENTIDRHWANAVTSPAMRPEVMPPAVAHRAQMRLVSLIESGDGQGAETTWRNHLEGIQGLLARSERRVPLDFAD